MGSEMCIRDRLTVEQVILTESGGGRAQVTVGLTWQGEALSVTVEVS